jgi:hypothetical protein
MTDEKKNRFNKGSEWRIWDLHIHTPASGFGQETDYPTLIQNLNNSCADVIGINDYTTIEGYEKILELGGLNKPFFPVVEFRMNNKLNHKNSIATDGGVSINFHIIFDNQLTTKQILTEINSLECVYEGGETTKLGHVEKINLNNVSFDFFSTIETLNKFLNGRFLVWLPYDEYGGIDNIDPINDSYFKLGLINKSQILGSGNQKQIHYFHSKQCFESVGKVIPCIKGSDSHEINYPFGKLRDKDSNPIERFCWIKADPTFEGLKQIIYEPQERVKIQNENPAFDFDKPFFSSINFIEDEQIFIDDNDLIFDKTSNIIELNPNLVTIIGGRGEGKSMLTEYISSSFYDKEKTKDGEFSKKGNLIVEYCKTIRNADEKLSFTINNEKHSVDFIYISQGDLKNQVEDREKKSKLATSISNLAKLKKSKFSTELNDKILQQIEELHKLKDFLSQKENSISYLEGEEKSTNEFINNITTEENKDKLEKYSKNLIDFNITNSKKEELNKLKINLNTNIEYLNETIKNTNGEIEKIPKLENASITYKNQIDAINLWISEIENTTKIIESEIIKVKSEFEEFYKGDLTTLLKDIDKFQNSLFEIRKQLTDTKEKEIKLSRIEKLLFIDTVEIKSLVSKIKEEYISQQSKILSDWDLFSKVEVRQDLNSQQKDIMKNLLIDLDIEVIIDFDQEKFYDEIYHCINGAEWRVKNNKQAQKDYFKISDLDTFFEFLKTRYLGAYYDTGFYKENLTSVLFDEEKRKKFIKVFPILKYQGKDLNKISVGQKGTVYLKMMLATEAFSKPIIFDQPEDDLDNEFIMTNLIDLFKDLKKYRQVIIVTHNANLVINADAEQVIIANNDKGKLKYISGSLENETINNKICEILEGGKIAFEKRRDKYKYVK